MIIECEKSPLDLIEEIGDPNFSICYEDWDEMYVHPNHPFSVRMIDCKDDVTIDITGISPDNSMRIASALCALLNQDYTILINKIHP
jgi:hypothetical protein